MQEGSGWRCWFGRLVQGVANFGNEQDFSLKEVGEARHSLGEEWRKMKT